MQCMTYIDVLDFLVEYEADTKTFFPIFLGENEAMRFGNQSSYLFVGAKTKSIGKNQPEMKIKALK